MNSNYSSQSRLQEAYEKAYKAYMVRANVTGIDIGYKYINGEKTDNIVVRIHVKEKISESNLEASEILPKEIDGIPVDVIQAIYQPQIYIKSTFERRTRRDAIQPGLSISHPKVTAGTFGAVVYDNVTERPCILSNWHVLVGSSDASPGDPILQPGSFDGGRLHRDRVGQLERSILERDGDAAIAFLDPASGRSVLLAQFGTGVVLKSARMFTIGEILEKSGRTTGVTRGKVDGAGTYKVNYPVGEREIDGFKLVSIRVRNADDEEISLGGDSGSIWYDPVTKEGVGLHFAGETDASPIAEHALACHLPRVLVALDVSLTPTIPGQRNNDKPERLIVNSKLQEVIDKNIYIPYGDIATSPLTQERELCQEIQQILKDNNFYRFEVEGIYGPITREALRDFKEAYALGGGDALSLTTAEFLLKIDKTNPVDGSYDFSTREGTISAFISECRKQGLTLNTQIAYILATVEHETAGTFKPVRETFWLNEDWKRRNLPYYPYYGRGYIQLTHRSNYQKYSQILEIDLVRKPELALEPKIALFIAIDGMAKGRFIGKHLGQFINANQTDFVGAGRVVSGLDRAHYIAKLAQKWLSKISLIESVTSEFTEDVETIDNDTLIEVEDIECEAHASFEEDVFPEAVLFPAINVQLSVSGQGYYSYSANRTKQFGLAETIQAIEAIARSWFNNHRSGPLIGVGNISFRGGGSMPPHSSHQRGLDVDFRLLRRDGARVGVRYQDPAYSRSRTQQLVNTIRVNSVLQVELILFNDPSVTGVQPWQGHDDHLHVRFKHP
jgi:hypothetical protein